MFVDLSASRLSNIHCSVYKIGSLPSPQDSSAQARASPTLTLSAWTRLPRSLPLCCEFTLNQLRLYISPFSLFLRFTFVTRLGSASSLSHQLPTLFYPIITRYGLGCLCRLISPFCLFTTYCMYVRLSFPNGKIPPEQASTCSLNIRCIVISCAGCALGCNTRAARCLIPMPHSTLNGCAWRDVTSMIKQPPGED